MKKVIWLLMLGGLAYAGYVKFQSFKEEAYDEMVQREASKKAFADAVEGVDSDVSRQIHEQTRGR